MSTYFGTTLLGILKGISPRGSLDCSPLETELLNAVTTGVIPAYSNSISLETLDEIAAAYFLSGEIDAIFKKRMSSETQKIFVSNDMLFKCIPSHYSCDECKGYRRKIRDIYKGTLLEILCAESLCDRLLTLEKILAEETGDEVSISPTRYPFIYDFLVIVGNTKNNRTKNPRNTNLLINRIDHFLCKENMFMIDILINNYGRQFISNNNWYLNNTSLISDRFVTLLLLEYNFDTSIIDTVTNSFDVDLDFITNMIISKFNLEKRTFAYAPIADVLGSLYKCIKYVYNRTPDGEKDLLISRICGAFAENIVTTEIKWKLLDVVMEVQREQERKVAPLIPIVYDEEPDGGYKVGRYFGEPLENIHFDVVDNKTFVFPSGLTPVEENKRVIEIYKKIKDGIHPYLSFRERKFELSSLSPFRSNLVFHIYCDVNEF